MKQYGRKYPFLMFLWDYKETMIYTSPFYLLFASMLLASDACGGYNTNFFCYGYPAILTHSFVYNFVFQRGSPEIPSSEHLSSGIILGLVPTLSFCIMVIGTRKEKFTKERINRLARMSFWLGVFFALWHELYWLVDSLIFHVYYGQMWYYKDYWNSIYYASIILVVSAFFIRRYRKIFWHRGFLYLTVAYNAFLFYWGFSNGFQITVAGGLAQPILTAYYYNFMVNLDEVLSWVLLGIMFIAFIAYSVFALKRDMNVKV